MRYILIALLLSFSVSSIHAQEVYNSSGRTDRQVKQKQKEKEGGFDPSRIVFGGGLGAAFGTVTNISVSPVVGYRFTDNLFAGVGFGYQYVRIKDAYLVPNYNTGALESHPLKASIYTPSLWARYVIWNNIFAHAEYEHNFMSFKEYEPDPVTGGIRSFNNKDDVPCLLLGGGLRAPITDRASFLIMALYDVLQDPNSPYRNTISFRFGFNVGF